MTEGSTLTPLELFFDPVRLSGAARRELRDTFPVEHGARPAPSH